MAILSRSILLAFLTLLATPTHARIVYQLIVYGDNVPNSVLDKVAANGLALLSKVLSSLPGFLALGPGQYDPTRRNLQSEGDNGVLSKQQEESDKPDEEIHRDLQMKSQCPASCMYKSSKTCRSIGCCATSGDRRRLRGLASTTLLTCPQTKLLEGVLDVTLAHNCLLKPGCTLKSKILIAGLDGSFAPVC